MSTFDHNVFFLSENNDRKVLSVEYIDIKNICKKIIIE